MRTLLALALLALGAVSSFACSGTDARPGDTLCDPDSLVFCRCRGSRPGTKLCASDGQSFEACFADDGQSCDEVTEETTSSGPGGGPPPGDGELLAPCESDGDCADGGVCPMGYCTKPCSDYKECAPPAGDCVELGGTAQCMPVCFSQEQCAPYGSAAQCSYTEDILPPASFGLPVCAAWGGEVVLPPDGFTCEFDGTAYDVVCNLGVSGAARVCGDDGGCTAGCHAGDDCPPGSSCSAQNVCAGACACGDGACDESCETPASCPADCDVPGDKCPGIAVALAVGTTVVQGNTADMPPPSEAKGSGACAPSAVSTEETIYAVTPAITGTLLALLEPGASFDPQLYVRSGSCTTGSQIACSDDPGLGVDEILEVSVTAGQKLSFFVDGWNGSVGPYKLTFLLEP